MLTTVAIELPPLAFARTNFSGKKNQQIFGVLATTNVITRWDGESPNIISNYRRSWGYTFTLENMYHRTNQLLARHPSFSPFHQTPRQTVA